VASVRAGGERLKNQFLEKKRENDDEPGYADDVHVFDQEWDKCVQELLRHVFDMKARVRGLCELLLAVMH
jgi:hypothetical protein